MRLAVAVRGRGDRRGLAHHADPLPCLAAARAVAVRQRHVRHQAARHPHERAASPEPQVLRAVPVALTALAGGPCDAGCGSAAVGWRSSECDSLRSGQHQSRELRAARSAASSTSRFVVIYRCRIMCRQRGRQHRPDRYRSGTLAPPTASYSRAARKVPGSSGKNQGHACQTGAHPAPTQDEGSSVVHPAQDGRGKEM